MKFYALRIVCQTCGSAFLVGGSAANDLAQWRRVTVECRQCSAETPAADGVTVDLRAEPTVGDVGNPAGSPHAAEPAWALS